MPEHNEKRIIKQLIILFGIFLIFIALSYPHLKNPYVFEPDADRIAMDGIFLLDFIKDLPGSLFHLYDYTITYYAKYPALSIGYRPILFPLAEAFFYALFGFSYLSARLALLLFLWVGMVHWFFLIKENFSSQTACLSLVLWLTNPMIYAFSQVSMLEIPTLSMSIVSLYYLDRFERSQSIKHALFLGAAVGLSLWTNQKAAFLLPLLLFYPVFKGAKEKLLKSPTFLAAGIILLFLIPLILITLWLGEQNLAQSIGTGESAAWYTKLKLFKNIVYLYQDHFSPVMLFFILSGIITMLLRKDKRGLLFATLIFSVYLFFTVIKVKLPRYPIYWIPAFCLFAMVGIDAFYERLKKFLKGRIMNLSLKGSGRYLLFSVPLVIQLAYFPSAYVGRAKGPDAAAQYVLKRTHSPVIFYHGYLNGQFIFFVRKRDPERKSVVLRGSKIITSSSIDYTNKLMVHLESREEIYQTLLKDGVHFVVVESINISSLAIFDELRMLLKDESRFKRHQKIPVGSNLRALKGKHLLIYENLAFKKIPKDRRIDLHLPIVGKTIRVELEKITAQ